MFKRKKEKDLFDPDCLQWWLVFLVYQEWFKTRVIAYKGKKKSMSLIIIKFKSPLEWWIPGTKVTEWQNGRSSLYCIQPTRNWYVEYTRNMWKSVWEKSNPDTKPEKVLLTIYKRLTKS